MLTGKEKRAFFCPPPTSPSSPRNDMIFFCFFLWIFLLSFTWHIIQTVNHLSLLVLVYVLLLSSALAHGCCLLLTLTQGRRRGRDENKDVKNKTKRLLREKKNCNYFVVVFHLCLRFRVSISVEWKREEKARSIIQHSSTFQPAPTSAFHFTTNS